MIEDSVNPIDPYHSVVVLASAGSGKTYQLSRRFLSLVLSGALPKSLLTVTFTKKATQEMRHRIISDALRLGNDKEFARQLVTEIESLRQQAMAQGANPPPLRSPLEASQEILNSTQSLHITTIDALFLQWCFEFQDQLSDKTGLIPVPWTPFDANELVQQKQTAWRQFLRQKDKSKISKTGLSYREFGSRSMSLYTLEGYLWLQSHKESPLGQSNHENNPIHAFSQMDSTEIQNIGELILKNQAILTDLISAISNKAKKELASTAIQESNWQLLLEAQIFKSDGTIHRRTVSKKVIETVGAPNLLAAEDEFETFITNEKIARLNQTGLELYSSWTLQIELMKKTFSQLKKGSFLDALQSCFLNLNDPTSTMTWFTSGRYKHILLDEYQDTSILQWKVLQPLCVELLSGNPSNFLQNEEANHSSTHEKLTPTVFIVGDPKQSIYGFREAEPKIFEYTASDLCDFEVLVSSLSSSWRSTELMMRFVNEVFETHLPLESFETHKSAIDMDPDQPRLSSIHLLIAKNSPTRKEAESPTNDAPTSAQETEAIAVADQISQCLDNHSSKRVWDQSAKKYRTATPSDIAVLYASSTHAHLLERELEKRQIPFRREGRKGFFALQPVSDVLSLLKCLVYPEDSLSLLAWLRSPLGLGEVDFFEFLKLVHEPNSRTDKSMNQPQLAKLSSMLILTQLEKSHSELFRLYEKSRDLLLHKDLASAISSVFMDWSIEQKLSVSAKESAEHSNEDSKISTLFYYLLDMANSQGMDLGAFMQRVHETESTDDISFNDSNSEHIKIMTIHKSKGLEFPIVFIADLGRPWTRTDPYWVKSDNGLCYVGTSVGRPKHPEMTKVIQSSFESQYHEKIRLLYVGITRAKEHLFLSGHSTSDLTDDLGPNSSSLDSSNKEPLNESSASKSDDSDDTFEEGAAKLSDLLKAPFLPSLIDGFESLTKACLATGNQLKYSSSQRVDYETRTLFMTPTQLELVIEPELTLLVNADPPNPLIHKSSIEIKILGTNRSQRKPTKPVVFESISHLNKSAAKNMPRLSYELPKQVLGTGIHAMIDFLVSKAISSTSNSVEDSFVSSVVRELAKEPQEHASVMAALEISVLRSFAHDLKDFVLRSSCWAKIQEKRIWMKSEVPLWECIADDHNSRQAKIHKIDLIVYKEEPRPEDNEYWIVDLKTGHPESESSIDDYISRQGYDTQLHRYKTAFLGTFDGSLPIVKTFLWMIELDQLVELNFEN